MKFPIKIEDIDFLDLACLAKVSGCMRDQISDHSNLKILTPKEGLQILPIAVAEVKAGNTSENLLNEIRKIIYSFYQAKEITKKMYNKNGYSI